MAKVTQPSPEQEADWRDWVASRPEVIRKIAERFDPWTLYRMKSTGHRCQLYSFSEDGTITVVISGKYNLIAFDRRVFDIQPDDLVECDLPAADEKLGAHLTQEEVKDNLDALRVAIRPDLWEMGPDGKAFKKTNH